MTERNCARVLVVDDVAANREIASAVLRAAGHDVEVTASGEEAVVIVRARPFDVILMDVEMPRLDGISATREIRGIAGAASRTPIVALTAHVFLGECESFCGSGMDDHIGKPFRFEQLREKVAYWNGRLSSVPHG